MSREQTALSAQINEHHRQAYGHAAIAIEHARQAGELLLQAKSQVPHGGWIPWLKANCEVGEREAQRYMRLARRWDELKSDTVTDLSLRGALERLDCREALKPAAAKLALAQDLDDGAERFPKLENGHSYFCYIKVNVLLILIVSESAQHPGYWHVADIRRNTITERPLSPDGVRAILAQDVRLSPPGFICRWGAVADACLFDGAAA